MFLAPELSGSNTAMSRLRSATLVRRGGTFALVLLTCVPVVLAFVPWQQHIVGTGRVAAYAPLDRQQTVEAPIAGRIVNWHVQEGSAVQQGDPLLEISDIDPGLVQRLEREQAALLGKVTAHESKLAAYESQIDSLRVGRDLAVTAAQFRIDSADERIRAAEQGQLAANATLTAATAQVDRMRALLKDGIASRREFEVAERDYNIAQTRLEQTAAGLESSRAERESLGQVLEETRATADAKISAVIATLRETESRLEDTRAALARLEVKLVRQQSQLVRAPRDGTVFRLIANQGGEIVKAGDPLLLLVPETDSQAVEIWVHGNDAPLVDVGRSVRLQFEGWPAVQFAGWPSVAVGTFGGRVALVDATDDGLGKFRLLVVPDPNEPDWPEQRFLRQGVRAKGWVLLDEVALAYELWRQLNGFPQSIQQQPVETDLARKRLK